MDPSEASNPEAGERWTWLIIAAHTQIRLLREAAAGLRRPWEKPAEPVGSPPPESAGGSGTSARTCTVRLGHQNRQLPDPAGPLARRNRQSAIHYDVGKTVKRPESIIERNRLAP